MKLHKKILLGLLIIPLLAGIAGAEYFKPLRKDQPGGFRIFDFSGGLNNKYSNHAIRDNELSKIKNFELTEKGALRKRDGYTKLSTVEVYAGETTVYSLMPYYHENGSTKYLLAATSSEVYKHNTTTDTWEALYTGLTADKRFTGAMFNNALYFGNGSDSMLQFNGTTVTTVAATGGINPPICKYILLHRKRLWTTGNSTYPFRVWFSALDNGASWEALNYFDVDPSDGSEITGLAVSMDSLIIFKSNSIFLLYGTSGDPLTDWTLKKINSDVGCIAPYSIRIVGDGVFFVSSKYDVRYLKGEVAGDVTGGLYTFDNLSADSISEKIQGSMDLIGKAYWQYAAAENFGDWYLLSAAKTPSTYNNQVFVYDMMRRAWTVFENIQAACFAIYEPANERKLYWGSSVDGFVHYYDTSKERDITTANGTIDAATLTTVQDTSQSWTTDELAGATVFIKETTTTNTNRIITSNTSDEITVLSAFGSTPEVATTFEVGAIDCYAYTKYFDMGYPEQEKKFKEMQIFLKVVSSPEVYAGWDVDFSNSSVHVDAHSTATWGTIIWGTDAWGSSSSLMYKRTLLKGLRGKYIRLSAFNCEADQPLSLYGFSVLYHLKGYTN